MAKLKNKSAPAALKSPAQEAGARGRGRDIMVMLGLIVVVLTVYLRVAGFEFINYDDGDYVANNPVVQSGLTGSGLKWAFTTGHAANWHPLTWLSHMLDCQLFGSKAGPQHLTNALLHALNSILLFVLLRRLTGTFWRSAIVAALWALHPMHVESVAWVSERKDVLSAFFGLLSLIFYTRYAQMRNAEYGIPPSSDFGATRRNAGSSGHFLSSIFHLPSSYCYWLAFLLLALGLMSKPMLVTLPFVMLLLDYWPLSRVSSWGKLIREKIPFFTLVVASCVITFVVQQRGQAVQSLEQFTVVQRLGNAVVSYARYLEKTFWPFGLANPYPHPGHWPLLGLLVSGLAVVGVTMFAWRVRRTAPFVLMGWLWFVGTLVPVIGIVQVGGQAMADRYVYLPHIGLFIALVWGLAAWWFPDLVTRHPSPVTRSHFDKSHTRTAWLGVGLTVLLIIGCGWRTVDQLGYWRNSETLFSHTLAVTKNNYVAWFSVGQYHDLHDNFDEAIKDYQTALAFKPDSLEILCNLGGVLIAQKKFEEGFDFIRAALKLYPDSPKARLFLAANYLEAGRTAEAEPLLDEVLRTHPEQVRAHALKGRVLAMRHEYDQALVEYESALAIGRNHEEALAGKAFVCMQQSRMAEAVELYEKVLRLNPTDTDVRNQFGSVFVQLNRLDEAVAQFQLALQARPGFANAHDNLGIALSLQGRLSEAVAQFREALRLTPDEANTHYNLANALAMQPAPDAAIAEYQEALRLDPAHVQAHCNLGVTLAAQGRRAEARTQLQETLRLDASNATAREQLQQLDAAP